MEFVTDTEVGTLLEDYGITRGTQDKDRVHLSMAGDSVVHMHVATAEFAKDMDAGANGTGKLVEVDASRFPDVFEGLLHRLHLDQVLLMPVGPWRNVFDAVAFSLAENEDWQEVDAAATVKLNERDPLLCTPADFHTVGALIRALYDDGESAEQGLAMLTPAAPILVECNPEGAMRMHFGTQVLADEAAAVIEGG